MTERKKEWKRKENKAGYTALGAPKLLYKRVNKKGVADGPTDGPTDGRTDERKRKKKKIKAWVKNETSRDTEWDIHKRAPALNGTWIQPSGSEISSEEKKFDLVSAETGIVSTQTILEIAHHLLFSFSSSSSILFFSSSSPSSSSFFLLLLLLL